MPLFRKLYFNNKGSYSLRKEGLTYSFTNTGHPTENYGLHSFRSGGATTAANAGGNDRLFKRHGRWKSETAKDGNVEDNIESLLSVTKGVFNLNK